MTMTLQEMLDKLAHYDFGVYSIPNGFVVADPLDNEDGFYLMDQDLCTVCYQAIECIFAHVES